MRTTMPEPRARCRPGGESYPNSSQMSTGRRLQDPTDVSSPAGAAQRLPYQLRTACSIAYVG